MKNYTRILPMLLLAIGIFVATTFSVGVFSQQDREVNVTGTAYEDTYESHQSIQEAFVNVLPYIGFIAGLLVAVRIISLMIG